MTSCFARLKPLVDGDRYYLDISGGVLHADCCGPERESYVKDVGIGEPLGPDDLIPEPQVWSEQKDTVQ